ncbi:MAG: hypothetical protein R6W90_09765 [Ignavibacteriaceae bacterium]
MKVRDVWIKEEPDKLIVRLIKDFFHPHEQWGRLNLNQFITGLICAAGYFLVNIFFGSLQFSQDSFINSSGGLISAVIICFGLTVVSFFQTKHKYPWFEKYLPKIITLSGLITLMALQNIRGTSPDDVALLMNIIGLLILFIITTGYFVEGNSNERVIKIWFAVFGYYFSVILFFYFCENIIFNI